MIRLKAKRTQGKYMAKPERNNSIPVKLAPDIHDGQDHGVHQQSEGKSKSRNDDKNPVEKKHEQVISRMSIKCAGFQSQTRVKILITRLSIKYTPVVVEEV